MPRKITTDIFIEKAKLVHGDDYDYSNTIYKNYHHPVTIICKKHGPFSQDPQSHIRGSGCQKCVNRYIPSKKEFIERAKKVHNNYYDYSKSNYTRCKDPIIIKCPIHGEFLQTAKSHIKGAGCYKCGKDKSLMTKLKFLERAIRIHKGIYNYDNIEYTDYITKVDIVCPKHGSFFQEPRVHLRGCGCPKCNKIVSKPETLFLNKMNIPDSKENRQVRIGKYTVDGLLNKTVFEFLGDYYHGNPSIYKKDQVNNKVHKTFGELFSNTIKKFELLKSQGYDIIYIWEKDWNLWVDLPSNVLPVKNY